MKDSSNLTSARWNFQTTSNNCWGGNVICSTKDIYYNNLTLVGHGIGYREPPYIVSPNDIPTWDFQFLSINTGDVSPYYVDVVGTTSVSRLREFGLFVDYGGQTFWLDDINKYLRSYGDYGIFNIPISSISNLLYIRNDYTITFRLYVRPDENPNSPDPDTGALGTVAIYDLGTYRLSLTSTNQDIINENSNKEVIGNINVGIDSINSSITNSNVDTGEFSKITSLTNDFSVNDGTFIDSIFTTFYTAFCTTEPVNLTFSMPFVNNSITIRSDLVSSNMPIAFKNFVSVFFWGLVLLYISKDIRGMINKISVGDIEHVSSDVKKEVL